MPRSSSACGRARLAALPLPGRADGPTGEAYRVDDFELASRLSYFLWSSMPDDALEELAAKNTLHEPAVLDREVERMLADPKAKALATTSPAQWLRDHTPGDRLRARSRQASRPTRTGLRDAMIEEAGAFFHAMLTGRRPAHDLIGADYSYINQTLAEHYGIKDVTGPEFRKVKLDGPEPGGVLGMAGDPDAHVVPPADEPGVAGEVGARGDPRHAPASAAARGQGPARPTTGRRTPDLPEAAGGAPEGRQAARRATPRSTRSASAWRASTRSVDGGPRSAGSPSMPRAS